MKYDLKVGYACNNNCIHCVVKPNYLSKEEIINDLVGDNTKRCINFTYSDIKESIDSDYFGKCSRVVVTGGEATLRKDFLHIMKYIKKTHPNMELALQTNGRLLEQYVEELYKLDENLFYVIAIHAADEETHNKIVNNRNETGSPFMETYNSLKKLQEVYGDKLHLRLEIVWSKYNYDKTLDILKFCNENKFNFVGFSYPHLDGYYMRKPEYLQEHSVSFNELKPHLIELRKFAEEHPEMQIVLEAVPLCMCLENPNDKRPSNLILDSDFSDNFSVTYVQYPKQEKEDFVRASVYGKKASCSACKYYECCMGVWKEALLAFPDDYYMAL